MEKLNDTIILRVSKADRERIRAKMDELGVMNMSAYIRKGTGWLLCEAGFARLERTDPAVTHLQQ